MKHTFAMLIGILLVMGNLSSVYEHTQRLTTR